MNQGQRIPRIVNFGEIMLRLSPEGYYRFFQNDRLTATFGGAEANVAVSLAEFGLDSAYVTKLPDQAIGQGAIHFLRGFGVDTSGIARGGDRVGLYYLEKGASQRGSACIYDRAHSSFSTATPDDFDWDHIFEGADWFHFSGITPALGGYLPQICREACEAAQRHGVKISCDINYRHKLWSVEEARPVMTELCRFVDVCIANEGQAARIFSLPYDEADDRPGVPPDHDKCRATAKALTAKFGFEKVALTLRTTLSANEHEFGGMLFDGSDAVFSRPYRLHIVDRVGGGDAFSAGLIYALLAGKNTAGAVEFASAASALKHSVEGDCNRTSADEVENLINGSGAGRIRR